MVIFNDLRISEDKDKLIIDCEVEGVDGYENIYIDGVYVAYYKKVSAFDDFPTGDYLATVYEKGDKDAQTHVRVCLDSENITKKTFGTDTFNGGMFFVYVKCNYEGTLNWDVMQNYGCGADRFWDIGIILDWKSVYEQGMGYAAKLALGCGSVCNEPTGFKQFILHWYALQLAISTCDYRQASKLWDRFIRMFDASSAAFSPLSSGCGCK